MIAVIFNWGIIEGASTMPKANPFKGLLPTAERLRHLLRYVPETGIFVWINPPPCQVKAGMPAGTLGFGGYCMIGIDGKDYKRSRLAWLYMTGVWSPLEIDHIDTNKQNDAWENLREASAKQNTANKRRYKNNSSGFKGVCFDKHENCWRARYGNGGRISIGRFKTKAEAIAAYKAKVSELLGTFARFD